MSKSATAFSVDGFEITATFADSHNTAAANHVKQILPSAFAANTLKLRTAGILAIPAMQRYPRCEAGAVYLLWQDPQADRV